MTVQMLLGISFAITMLWLPAELRITRKNRRMFLLWLVFALTLLVFALVNIKWPSMLLYVTTGALFGLAYPLRLAFRLGFVTANKSQAGAAYKLVQHKWLKALGLAVVHGAFWPISMVAGFAYNRYRDFWPRPKL